MSLRRTYLIGALIMAPFVFIGWLEYAIGTGLLTFSKDVDMTSILLGLLIGLIASLGMRSFYE